MLLIGLTGNIASGKSTVSRMLVDRGATLIDADELARIAVLEGTPAYGDIVRRWGDVVIGTDGQLDRAALREKVFSDQAQLEELNAMVHPEVTRLRNGMIDKARERGDRVVVCDIPLLFERRLVDEFDKIVLVDAPRSVRLDRLVQDRALSPSQALDMVKAQMPAELKRARADFVIDNTGTVDDLERRVAEVWEALDRAAENAQQRRSGPRAMVAGADTGSSALP